MGKKPRKKIYDAFLPCSPGPMAWTTEKPTKPGWYWYRPPRYKLPGHHKPEIVEIIYTIWPGDREAELFAVLSGKTADYEESILANVSGLFAGPIEPPL